jgi:ribonuclease P protein component
VALPKSRRLVKQTEIQRVFRTKFKSHDPVLSVYLSKVAPSKLPKYQVVVPKKILKRAHDRNKVKRRIFGILEPKIAHLSELPFSIILIARSPKLVFLSHSELDIMIQNLIKKATPQKPLYKRN